LSAVDTAISLCDASSAAPDPPPAVARVRTRATSTA
jgi:hypothetical protein